MGLLDALEAALIPSPNAKAKECLRELRKLSAQSDKKPLVIELVELESDEDGNTVEASIKGIKPRILSETYVKPEVTEAYELPEELIVLAHQVPLKLVPLLAALKDAVKNQPKNINGQGLHVTIKDYTTP
jgi:hypothetical protein